MIIKLCLLLLMCLVLITPNDSNVINDEKSVAETKQTSTRNSELDDERRRKKKCPLCDPSVYSYCSDKLFHDSCCCSDVNNSHYPLPYECRFADCSFLHANSCYEHHLITSCCCTKGHHTTFFRKQRSKRLV